MSGHARPGGYRQAWVKRQGGVKPAGDTPLIRPDDDQEARAASCRGCEYLGRLGSMPCCDYMLITGHARTVYRGIKSDRCPRKQRKRAKKV